MYNKSTINSLMELIYSHNGINDKDRLQKIVSAHFNLTKARSVYYCEDFAIRFSRSNHKNASNTVLSLSTLIKYDDRPFFICLVTPEANFMWLANTTFIHKISQSSHKLAIDNIKGSFNVPNISKNIFGMENRSEYFEELYEIHRQSSQIENIERIVAATDGIVGWKPGYIPNDTGKANIYNAPNRAAEFLRSSYYTNLKADLDRRVNYVKPLIVIAAGINNVNIRGRLIEYLISLDNPTQDEPIIYALSHGLPLPRIFTDDKLGDYLKTYPGFNTATDIKTKLMDHESCPKGYNIDKFLAFMSQEESVYMTYIVGIHPDGRIDTNLCPAFQTELLDMRIDYRWASRNSRGTAQFMERDILDALYSTQSVIDIERTEHFLKNLVEIIPVGE